MEELIILVDKNNKEIWYWEKQDVHEKWLLHRAFSIFIFNDKNELLLQQRAIEKYHCGWLRTNTVCSHPRKQETYEIAIHRRMIEEVWFDCKLKKIWDIIYNHKFENWLSEYEHDTIFIWNYNKEPKINTNEIMDYKWINISDLINEVKANPKNFTPWFIDILNKFNKELWL